MPIIQFRCKAGHLSERIFLSHAEVDKSSDPIICIHCAAGSHRPVSLAERIDYPLTAPAQFKGDGWTPRFSTAGESQIGGIPVKKGDDPQDIAKKIVASGGGGKKLTDVMKRAR
jgi:hypothetical protein